jgi:aminoglycoside 6'-N-acetyltransferase I
MDSWRDQRGTLQSSVGYMLRREDYETGSPTIRKADGQDAAVVAELALALWPENTADALAAEVEEFFAADGGAVFLACVGGAPVGFAQCGLRHDYVEGTDSSPVGYLEGIYVGPGHRRRGLARALLAACEDWARDRGCSQFASDCEVGNDRSIAFHRGAGFAQANRIVCFVKPL